MAWVCVGSGLTHPLDPDSSSHEDPTLLTGETAGPLKFLAQVRAPFCLCLMSICFKPVASIYYSLPLSLEAWIGETCLTDEGALYYT